MIPSPVPPLLVQAYRKGQFITWITDSQHPTLEAALAAAEKLHLDWGRKVKVIDQEDRVWLRLPRPKRGPRG